MTVQEWSGVSQCYCGRQGCIEQWVSGPGLAAHFASDASHDFAWSAEIIAASAVPEARAAMTAWMELLGRALASVMNILDPDVIVLGGGLSNIESLYRDLPALVERHAFMPEAPPRVVRNRHGDSSGVRGAAWLWDSQ
jgi:fructokinase